MLIPWRVYEISLCYQKSWYLQILSIFVAPFSFGSRYAEESRPPISLGILSYVWYGWHSKNRRKTPKMDGENNGKPY